MRLQPTLLWKETLTQPKVQTFLDSVRRNSARTERIYGIGLAQFQTFLHRKYEDKYNIETIIEALANNEINVYTLLEQFINYLCQGSKLSSNSVKIYLTGVRSYLQYYDIDIVPAKFKRKVRLPKNHREDEEPLDAADIRKILLSCNNRRVKAYLLVLASGGLRATEAIMLRLKDVDFSVSPTKLHIRSEFAKTRVGREVYISDEATKFVKEWLDFRYRERDHKDRTPPMLPDDLIFSKKFSRKSQNPKPEGIYLKILEEFNAVLKTVGMDQRKDGMLRRRITLHSFRRWVKTVVSDQVGSDYSEWFLGHSKSPYWTKKEKDRRDIYANKVMSYLTFLDYSALESTGKGIESQLENKDKEIAYLRERDLKHEIEMKEVNERIARLDGVVNKIDKLEKELGI